tara:strand:- start:387 stop:1082 length:696 start_codon:yes stop_codon:yes gene_type:complete
MDHLIPDKDNPHPLLKLEGNERKNFTIKSIIITLVMTSTIYLLPNYYWLEMITTDSSYFLLSLFGYEPRLFIYEDNFNQLSKLDQWMYLLYDSDRASYPAISLDSDNLRRRNYLIVRACTGMQAGALLLGLIWSTPAKSHDRIRASYTVLIALFIGNVMRIAAMIAITTILIENFGLTYSDAWMYAHDWLGRPLGFFGTIGFTVLIEIRDVKILDTITVWIDTLMGTKTKK